MCDMSQVGPKRHSKCVTSTSGFKISSSNKNFIFFSRKIKRQQNCCGDRSSQRFHSIATLSRQSANIYLHLCGAITMSFSICLQFYLFALDSTMSCSGSFIERCMQTYIKINGRKRENWNGAHIHAFSIQGYLKGDLEVISLTIFYLFRVHLSPVERH